MATNNNNRSTTSFDNMKHEIAKELNIDLREGYNGHLAARDAGKIGGNIVKRVFAQQTGNNYPVKNS